MLTTLGPNFREIGHVQGLPPGVIGVVWVRRAGVAGHDSHEDGRVFSLLPTFLIDLLASRFNEIRAPLFQLVRAEAMQRDRRNRFTHVRRAAGQPRSLANHLSRRQLAFVCAHHLAALFGWPRLPCPSGKDLCMHELEPHHDRPF